MHLSSLAVAAVLLIFKNLLKLLFKTFSKNYDLALEKIEIIKKKFHCEEKDFLEQDKIPVESVLFKFIY